MKKIIILNGGKRTRLAFEKGLSSLPLEAYQTKKTILHIDTDSNITFINDKKIIDFSDSYIFTRIRSHDEIFVGMLYEHFKAIGVQTSDDINVSFKRSGEKIAQMPRLARAHIKIPETIIARAESYDSNKDYIYEHMSFPLIYKTDGNKGEAVFKVESIEELESRIASNIKGELFLLQEYIPNTFDTRTLVAYETILGSIKRIAQKGAFHNNVSQGGSVEAYELTDEEKEISIRATHAVMQDFGGVDIIHTEKGPVVLEVNKAPQIAGFESIHGSGFVFESIAALIEKRLH